MDQIDKIKELVASVLSEDISLYDVSWHNEGNNRILRVSIMRSDGTMDIDTCASMSENISTRLDEEDLIPNEYFLEVCSPGAERELKGFDQIHEAINEFIYVKMKNPKAGLAEVKGTLIEADEDKILLQYMDKAVKKKVEIDMENIALIRLSVKI